MKKLVLLALLFGGSLFLTNCGGSGEGTGQETTQTENSGGGEEASATAENTESSGDEANSKGVGPVSSVELGEGIDEEMAKKGEELFASKGCNACHEIDSRKVGPALKGVTERRTPEWIMNMILNPTEMVQKDPIAKKLLAEYSAPMSQQNLTEEEARAMLEYFRKIDSNQ